MAKKTTKKTGAKPVDDARAERRRLDDVIRNLEDAQAARAVERAIRWARLLDQLEVLLDHADSLFSFGWPIDEKYVEQVHAEELALHAKLVAERGKDYPFAPPTLGDVRAEQIAGETDRLVRDLQLAENWLPMIGDEYRIGHGQAVADIRLRLEGKAPIDLTATPAEAIAIGITCVRTLFETDRRRAKGFSSVPSEEDIDVLERLRDARKTAKELAVEIAGKGKSHAVDEKRVERAIQRLKNVHGFELPNLRGSGYSLSPSDLARLDALRRGT